jgi:hypothetical protein
MVKTALKDIGNPHEVKKPTKKGKKVRIYFFAFFLFCLV